MKKEAVGHVFIVMIIVVAFWLVGLTLLMLNQLNITHIAKWIVTAHFWAPYALFMLIFGVRLLIEACKDRKHTYGKE